MVGFGPETYRDEFEVTDLNWLAKPEDLRNKIYDVRIRHGGKLIPCRVKPLKVGLKVRLEEPQRGVAPGQSAVFYEDGVVLGGGIIS